MTFAQMADSSTETASASVDALVAVPQQEAPDITDEGKAATVLDAPLQLRLDAAVRRSKVPETLSDAITDLGELLRQASERYGQVASVCAPVYFAYGNALLIGVEDSKDALGDAAPGAAGDEGSDEEEEDQDEEEGAGASGEPAEEDITNAEADKDKETEDLEIAWECLDTARVLYERMGPAHELDLARVHLRLGDCHVEGEKFQPAVEEYKKAFELRKKHLQTHDRALADPLNRLMNTHLQLASEKDVDDNTRRALLAKALKLNHAANEVMMLALLDAAKKTSNHKMQKAIIAEIEAGAHTKVYPKVGTITTAVGVESPAPGAGASAGAGASSSADGLGSEVQGDVDIRIFRTIYEEFSAGAGVPDPNHTNPAAAGAAAAEAAAMASTSSSSSNTPTPAAVSAPLASVAKPLDMEEACEIIDALIARSNDIMDDLGVSVKAIVQEVGGGAAGNSSSAGAAPSSSNGFGAAGAAAAAAPALAVAVRKAAPAAPSAAPAAGEKRRAEDIAGPAPTQDPAGPTQDPEEAASQAAKRQRQE